jgi:hypothetical protein
MSKPERILKEYFTSATVHRRYCSSQTSFQGWGSNLRNLAMNLVFVVTKGWAYVEFS